MTFYTYTPVLIIGLASSVISGILGISKQKKYARYASLIAIICIAILFYVSHGIDVYYDKRFYDSVISLQILGSPEIFNEWVWRLMCLIGNKLGLDFFTFRLCVLLVLLTLVYSSIKKYCSDYGWVLLVYLTYFIYVDAMQLQNTIAMCIFMISLKYVIDRENGRNIFKFMIALALAAEIHSAYWVSFIYLILFIKDKKTISKLLVGLEVLLIGITYLNNNYVPIVSTMMASTTDSRLSNYSSSATIRSWIVIFMLLIVYTICIYLIHYHNKKNYAYYEKVMNESELERFQNKNDFLSLVLIIDIISFLIIPMNMMITHMNRLIRNIAMLQYLCIFSNYKYISRKGVQRVFLMGGVVVTVIVWRIFEFHYNSDYEQVVVPVLRGLYFYE
ncbi:hypothetical protein GN277_12640 [Lachnospiraceae bacterium WCA-9-b2]|uniref:EpsG family protein n=1 Tax=Sporofaciens musculi TaxID=2681861 RepID=A0A7X3SJB1_9FIRM|nr:EpsG family protein [Sporofaciens musculi]MXP76209.1 hypothetical protein [Sporofaciens musculi]